MPSFLNTLGVEDATGKFFDMTNEGELVVPSVSKFSSMSPNACGVSPVCTGTSMTSVTLVEPSGSKHTDDKLHVEVLLTAVVFVAVVLAHESLYASLTIY